MSKIETLNNMIIAYHDNGYKGKIFGRGSMVIYAPDGWIMHTHERNRSIQTGADLMRVLGEMPEFREILEGDD